MKEHLELAETRRDDVGSRMEVLEGDEMDVSGMRQQLRETWVEGKETGDSRSQAYCSWTSAGCSGLAGTIHREVHAQMSIVPKGSPDGAIHPNC